MVSYIKCIEMVCIKEKTGVKVDDKFIEFITEEIEKNLFTQIDFEINPDDEEQEFMKYAVYAVGEVNYKYKNKNNEMQIKNFIIDLNRYTLDDNFMLNVRIYVGDDYVYEGIEDEIYKLKIEIKNILKQYFKNIYWQFDEHNNNVCKELYGKIHTLENQFRQLIIEFLVKSYGYEWEKKLGNKVLKNKIVEYSNWYKSNYEEFKDVYIDLFNLQVSDLITFLKSVYETENVQKDTEKCFEIAAVNSRLTKKGTDKVVETIKLELNKVLEKNSIWSLYLSDILGDGFIELWNRFEKMRNMVAHNKPICKKLYNDCIEVEGLLTDRFQKFGNYIELNFDTKNKEKRDFLDGKRKIEIQQYEELYRSDAGLDSMPSDDQEVFEEINEHDDIIQFLDIIEEYVDSFKRKAEELLGYLEDPELYENNEMNSNVISIINDDNELTEDEIYEKRCELVNMLRSGINEIEYESGISIGNIAMLYGLWEESLQVEVEGDICIEEGHTDELIVKIQSNEELIEKGIITKTYGEYYVSDYGVGMPEVEDYLGIDLNEVQDYLEDKFNDTIDKLDRCIGVFEE